MKVRSTLETMHPVVFVRPSQKHLPLPDRRLISAFTEPLLLSARPICLSALRRLAGPHGHLCVLQHTNWHWRQSVGSGESSAAALASVPALPGIVCRPEFAFFTFKLSESSPTQSIYASICDDESAEIWGKSAQDPLSNHESTKDCNRRAASEGLPGRSVWSNIVRSGTFVQRISSFAK